MRYIKVVAYGNVANAADSNIIAALIDVGMDPDRITIYSVNTALDTANEVIAIKEARIAELEKLLDDRTDD